MSPEEQQLYQERHARIRRLKRFLRPLPRRTNVHRYPFLKWFAQSARKKAFLWSFRPEAVSPALILGSILTFLPLYGVQIPIALALALALHANLPLFVGLQLVTNPLTVAPIYFINFQVGRLFMKIYGMELPELSLHELREILETIFSGSWDDNLGFLLKVFLITCLGGVIIGLFTGIAAAQFYRYAAKRTSRAYERLRVLRHEREQRLRENPPQQDKLFRKARLFSKRFPKGFRKKGNP